MKRMSPYIGQAGALLYRRGNFDGSWDNVICDAIREQKDVEIALVRF